MLSAATNLFNAARSGNAVNPALQAKQQAVVKAEEALAQDIKNGELFQRKVRAS